MDSQRLKNARDRLENIERQLKERGMKSFHFSLSENPGTIEQITEEACNLLQAILDDKGTPLIFNDSKLKCDDDCDCTCNKE